MSDAMGYGQRLLSRVLVTGGAGFIGAHLCQRLSAAGHEVVVLDNLSWGDAAKLQGLPGVTAVHGDVRGSKALSAELGSFSHVVHLAALISAYQSLDAPDDYFDNNVTGLLRVLEAFAGGARFVLASTSGVYGNTPHELKRESDVPQPATVYAATKLTGEHLLAMYRGRLSFDDVALRFFNVYGPGQSPKHPYANVTCRFAQAAAQGLPVQLYGDGEQTRDFVFVDDVVDAIMTVAFSPTRERVYNIGSGQTASIGQLLAEVQRISGRELVVERLPPWQNDIRAIRADVSRFRGEFGERTLVPLQTGLLRTIEYFAQSRPASA